MCGAVEVTKRVAILLLEKLAAHGLHGCTLLWVKNQLDGQA